MVLPTVTGASKGQHTESSRSPASMQAAYCANMPRDGMAGFLGHRPAQCEWPLRPEAKSEARHRGTRPQLACTYCLLTFPEVSRRPLGLAESAWSAVSALPLVRFSRPLAEPAVHLSTQRALRGFCRWALVVAARGVWMQTAGAAQGRGSADGHTVQSSDDRLGSDRG